VEESGCSICLGITRLGIEENQMAQHSQSGGYGKVKTLDSTGTQNPTP
jgi:hypothetical protein